MAMNHSLAPRQMRLSQADPNEERSTLLIVVSSIFSGIGVLACVLRIYARRLTRVSLGVDDNLAVGATVCFHLHLTEAP